MQIIQKKFILQKIAEKMAPAKMKTKAPNFDAPHDLRTLNSDALNS
jgi:hypothetical protein